MTSTEHTRTDSSESIHPDQLTLLDPTDDD